LVHDHAFLRALAAVLLFPLVAFALGWHAVGFPGALALLAAALALVRKLRRLRLRRIAVAGALLLVPQASHPQPYLDDPLGASPMEEPEPPRPVVLWVAGVSIGPYVPRIDEQFGQTPGPYEQMFGTSPAWVPMLDVERVVWDG